MDPLTSDQLIKNGHVLVNSHQYFSCSQNMNRNRIRSEELTLNYSVGLGPARGLFTKPWPVSVRAVLWPARTKKPAALLNVFIVYKSSISLSYMHFFGAMVTYFNFLF